MADGPCDCGADRCTGFKQGGAHVEKREMRTTKYLVGTFKAVYHGDYLTADEVADDFLSHIDGGLDDRDDLRSWGFEFFHVVETYGDPEGYDS